MLVPRWWPGKLRPRSKAKPGASAVSASSSPRKSVDLDYPSASPTPRAREKTRSLDSPAARHGGELQYKLPVPWTAHTASPLENLSLPLPVEGEAVMLLRSASSPLLNAARVPTVGAGDHVGGHLAVVPAASPAGHRQGLLCHALSEADLLAPVTLPAARSSPGPAFVEEDEDAQEDEDEDVFRRLLTSTGLDLDAAAGREEAALALLEGVGGGGGRGRVCRGGHGGRGGDGDGDGRGAADAHYRRMIRANPGNSLPLGNYARYLKEVERDAARAQEYCERAIVANPGDGDALALYAGLVWETSRDAERADAYYSRAVLAAPGDCYVLGSYAGFLWDAEEEDDLDDGQPPATPPFHGAAQPPSIRAAS